jgi:hypothetical protein
MNPTEEIAARLVGGAQAAYVRELSYFFLHLFGEVVRTNGAVLKGQEIADFDRLARISREEALGIYYKYRPYIEKQTRETLKRSLKATDDILIGQFIRVLGKRSHMTNLATLIGSQTAQGLYEVINRQNIALAEQQEALWYEVTAEAIARHQAGEPTRAVMERGVTRLANSGLETIDYISGTKTTIDAALRRHIVSQANQARNRLLMQRMDEWEWDLVFVDAHFGARPTHAVWQGKVYSRSGRSTEYPPLVESTGYGTVTGLCGANCVVGDTKVSGPYASAAYRRKYSGQIVTIRTALGHNLTVTPNHPILTLQGWVAASQLKKGDYVFSRVNRDRMPLGVRPDKYECEPTIKQEFDSLRDTFGIRAFLGSSANFHNDGIANQNVDVVFVNSSLVDNVKTKRFKHTPKPALFDASRLSDCSLGLGSFAKVSMRFSTTSYSILRMFTKSPSLFQRTSRHSSFGSHSSILRENSSFLKSISNCRLGNTKLLSNNSFIEPFIPKINDTFDINTLLTSIGLQAKSFEFAGDNPIPASEMLPHGPDRSSFIVEPDKIVGIDIRMWSGHVYNLSTQNAWYFANSIVTHNCYHNMAPYVPGLSQLPDTDFADQEKLVGMTSDEYYAATQKQRRYERYIRNKKREIVSFQEAGLDATKQRLQLGTAQDKLKQWVADNHLRRDYQRERAWAVDMQPRALYVAKSYTARAITTGEEFVNNNWLFSQEYAVLADKEGNVVSEVFKGEKRNVLITLPDGYEWEDLQVFHTHPFKFGGTFSVGKDTSGDIRHVTAENLIGDTAVCNEGAYYIRRTKSSRPKAFYKAAREAELSIDEEASDLITNKLIDKGITLYNGQITYSDYYELIRIKKAEMMHEWFSKNAKIYGYEYWFEPSGRV